MKTGNSKIFIEKDSVRTINALYSFYNLKDVDYSNIKLEANNIKKLEKYEKILIHNPSKDEISFLHSLDNIEIILIFDSISTSILNYISLIKNCKILIFNQMDEIFLDNNDVKNYYLINPIKEKEVILNYDDKSEENRLGIVNCFSRLKSLSLENIESLIKNNMESYTISYKGLKEVDNDNEYKKLKRLLFNNVIVSSFPILKLEQNIIDTGSIISLGSDFPIEVLYYLKNSEDGEIFYKNDYNLDWYKSRESFQENKLKLESFLLNTKTVEEVV